MSVPLQQIEGTGSRKHRDSKIEEFQERIQYLEQEHKRSGCSSVFSVCILCLCAEINIFGICVSAVWVFVICTAICELGPKTLSKSPLLYSLLHDTCRFVAKVRTLDPSYQSVMPWQPRAYSRKRRGRGGGEGLAEDVNEEPQTKKLYSPLLAREKVWKNANNTSILLKRLYVCAVEPLIGTL